MTNLVVLGYKEEVPVFQHKGTCTTRMAIRWGRTWRTGCSRSSNSVSPLSKALRHDHKGRRIRTNATPFTCKNQLILCTSTFNHVCSRPAIFNLIIRRYNTLNLLKPTGHVMHQQFNIQQLYVLTTLYLCVLYLSENKQRLVPLTA